MENASFINGPSVKSFQKNLENYLNVKHVIPCANGTDALQIAMMGLNLKPGDEVITVDFTFAGLSFDCGVPQLAVFIINCFLMKQK